MSCTCRNLHLPNGISTGDRRLMLWRWRFVLHWFLVNIYYSSVSAAPSCYFSFYEYGQWLTTSSGQVAETLAHGQRLMEPHLQATKDVGLILVFPSISMWTFWRTFFFYVLKKLLPVARAHFNSLKNSANPYALAAANASTRAYKACRDAMQPCMMKTREFADHYWQVMLHISYSTHCKFATVQLCLTHWTPGSEHERFHCIRHPSSSGSASHTSLGLLQHLNLISPEHAWFLNLIRGLSCLPGHGLSRRRVYTITRCSLHTEYMMTFCILVSI
jgi:hypothetical protein